MLYTDRVKDAIAVLKTDLEEMNDLSSDRGRGRGRAF